ncbi:transporter [Bacillus subtilis]|uniref:formate/nitrite transporter family protein n=1 Tax=Bacillus subtilis TaxID=1423 RepID=UPI00100A12F1|nr:formate/nitrite transporter family protein [Bacillus subtilis]QAV86204.1 transporter [Bacillus subtilis]WJD92288.1 formate/nitrite transporter family protein [Bacillus spizizenii]
METQALQKVEQYALKKQNIFASSKIRYVLRSILASMFIGFGITAASKTGSYFFMADSPFAFPAAAVTFGAAILMIAYGGGDLFTGNTFYFTYTALRKKISWRDTLYLWMSSYAGNLIGAILFAILISATGLFEEPSVHSFLIHLAEHKLEPPASELFFRGMLCNWLVCLAFFIPMSLKGEGAKLFTMMLFVFCFFISGFEHSIANMCTFAISLLIEHPDTVTLMGAVRNLIPVTLGNLTAGIVMMGWMYYTLNPDQ